MPQTNQLGYLLHHLSFTVDRQSDQILLERLGIGFSQFKILMALRSEEGVRQKQIADYLGQTEASISRQIKIMQNKGLLKSRVSPISKRAHITILTPKGLSLADEALDTLNHYHGPMFARLSAKQQSNLSEILNAMHPEVCRNDKPGHCNRVYVV